MRTQGLNPVRHLNTKETENLLWRGATLKLVFYNINKKVLIITFVYFKKRTKQLARKSDSTVPGVSKQLKTCCTLRKAGDELLSMEPGLSTEENIILKKNSESSELTDQSPFERIRMSGTLLYQKILFFKSIIWSLHTFL
jgi:hypothetical protein